MYYYFRPLQPTVFAGFFLDAYPPPQPTLPIPTPNLLLVFYFSIIQLYSASILLLLHAFTPEPRTSSRLPLFITLSCYALNDHSKPNHQQTKLHKTQNKQKNERNETRFM